LGGRGSLTERRKEKDMAFTFADVMLFIIAACCIIFVVAGMDVV